MEVREPERPQRALAWSPSHQCIWKVGGYEHGRAGPVPLGDDRTDGGAFWDGIALLFGIPASRNGWMVGGWSLLGWSGFVIWNPCIEEWMGG